MKKTFLLCVNLFLLIFSCFATNISGFINSNTTWNLAGSPYIITGNTLLSHGYTLTINPGVIIKFDLSKALQIDGELIAVGTPQNRITFTSNQLIPNSGDWAKLHFADTCVNAVFDINGNYLSGSIMKYCDVLYGGGIGFGEIHIENSSPYLSHCKFMNSSASGVYSSGSPCLIDSSSAKNNLDYGFYFENYNNNSFTELLILGDTLENNYSGGVFLANAPNAINFKNKFINNHFIANSMNGAIHFSYYADSLIISNNYFLGNSNPNGGVIDFNIAANYDIECNKFINNLSTCIFTFDDRGGTVKQNIFEGNTTQSFPAIFLNLSTNFSNVFFEKNYINNNSSPSYQCKFMANAIDATTFLHINKNHFINNSSPSILHIESINVSNTSFNYVEMKNNSFSDPGHIELDNAIPYGSPNIYADSNYWGGTSTQHIDSVIFDYFDDANKSVVYYTNYLLTPLEVDTFCHSNTSVNYSEINSKEITTSITISPNPFNSFTAIRCNQAPQQTTIKIMDVLGKEIKTINFFGNECILEKGEMNPGIYFVRIEIISKLGERNKIVNRKIIVQ